MALESGQAAGTSVPLLADGHGQARCPDGRPCRAGQRAAVAQRDRRPPQLPV